MVNKFAWLGKTVYLLSVIITMKVTCILTNILDICFIWYLTVLTWILGGGEFWTDILGITCELEWIVVEKCAKKNSSGDSPLRNRLKCQRYDVSGTTVIQTGIGHRWIADKKLGWPKKIFCKTKLPINIPFLGQNGRYFFWKSMTPTCRSKTWSMYQYINQSFNLLGLKMSRSKVLIRSNKHIDMLCTGSVYLLLRIFS